VPGRNRSFSPAVIAPTFNNAQTLRTIIDGVIALNLQVFVVDDGSTDQTAQILADLAKNPAVVIVTHPANRGKAAALYSGFAAAEAAGFTHAATIDTDGQLDPADLTTLLEAVRQSQTSLIVGIRDESAPDYPARSNIGRRISNFLVWLECGLRVDDSQCGLRVYPLSLVRFVQCRAGRFGFETEIITRAGWAGCDVRGVPVSCRYQLPAGRVSHFRPWIDSFRAVAMHFCLLGRTLLPLEHAKWRGRITQRESEMLQPAAHVFSSSR
jgi:glycosyltransferase involved in cell wall biosynthesis